MADEKVGINPEFVIEALREELSTARDSSTLKSAYVKQLQKQNAHVTELLNAANAELAEQKKLNAAVTEKLNAKTKEAEELEKATKPAVCDEAKTGEEPVCEKTDTDNVVKTDAAKTTT